MNFFKKFNKLNFKDKTKNKKLLSLAVTIFGIGLIITGTSAAYLMSQYEGSINKITAGTLVLSLPSESEGITLSGALPMSDEVGLNQDTSYTFTLKNAGTLPMDYKISLNNTCSTNSTYTIDGVSVKPDVCIPDDYIKVGVKKGTENYKVINLGEEESLLTGVLNPNEEINFEIKIWLDEATPNDYNGVVNETLRNVIYYGKLVLEGNQKVNNLDESGANKPVLASNMIPVYYDGENWRKADKLNGNSYYQWYSYADKKWANAVTVTEVNGSRSDLLDADVGTPIPMDRINTMMVWIPRFSATGDYETYNGTNDIGNPGAFNITFVDNNTSAHDAFDFGSAISGFWIGKFENSSDTNCSPADYSAVGEGCNLTNIRPKILPNATSWRGAMVSTFFYDILAMTESGNAYGFDKTKDTTLDTHMLKNNEWGAVAYLTQSIYGRCTSSTSCTEVGINNNSSYVTGYGAPAGSSRSVTNGTYETSLGMDASTTGNIYGVYDMSGGSYEYVMGVYWDGTKYWSGYDSNRNSGFNGCLGTGCSSTLENGTAYPSDNKYYNLYTTESAYTNAGLQHGMTETSGWYGDYATFVYSTHPWFLRGGDFSSSSDAGVFYFNGRNGRANPYYGSRASLKIN